MCCFNTLRWSLLFSLWTLSINPTLLAASEEFPLLLKPSIVRGNATKSARASYGFRGASTRDSGSKWRGIRIRRGKHSPAHKRRRVRRLLEGKDSKKRQGVIGLFIILTFASLQIIATCWYCVLQLKRYLLDPLSDTLAVHGSVGASDLTTFVSFSTAVFVVQPGGSLSLAIEDQILET